MSMSTMSTQPSMDITSVTSVTELPEVANVTQRVSEADATRQLEVLFQFIAEGIILTVVGLLGILGNIVSMIILSRPQMRSSINYILIGLARCDTVLIVTSILLFGLPAIHAYTGYLYTYQYYVYPHIAPVVYPISLIAQTISVYLTVTVTFERFVAVCHPLQARSYCTYGRARIYVLLTIVFSVLYNASRFFEVHCCEMALDKKTKKQAYFARPTTLRQNSLYINLYINGMYLVFIYMVPFTMLAVLNAAIYRQIRRANAERQRLSRLQKKEIGLATMLLCVVMVFFMCNILALVANVMEAFNGVILDPLIKTSNLLVTINSSVNFVIYVIYGEKFKRLFLKLFCPQGKLLCGSPANGRDSPECDSVVSNGDGRSYSVRSNIQMQTLNRCNTALVRNGSRGVAGGCGANGPTRAAPAGSCVYYPQTPGGNSEDNLATGIATTVLDE
ncbi:FMRFamide receptor-like [Thrips palmi]|uniref:FMRFamide receptor-like n=1 Tax=Thrips palmi TaxID=161013 RepID=A0A6P8ZZ32_THRPL|nr:FMRFamide receptor-like [Thrips palmi]